jgi:DNA-binding transcriptional ArsR family regulator
MDEWEVVARFGSLGQPTRLAVLRSLLKVHPDGLNAGDIARMFDVPHNTMSAHLAVLSRAGLVLVERQGRVMNYRADLRGYRDLVHGPRLLRGAI